jgi:hypothetical protein
MAALPPSEGSDSVAIKHTVSGAATAPRWGVVTELSEQDGIECDKYASSVCRMDGPTATLVDCTAPWPLGLRVRKKP